jgi:hypothetical protein
MQANYDVELHPSREMGGGHTAHSSMKWMAKVRAAMMDGGGEAEQMALMVTYFAAT